MDLGEIKSNLKNIAYDFLYHSGLLSHKTNVEWNNVKCITCKEGDITPLHKCSNILYRVSVNSIDTFFRPILPHCDLNTSIRQLSVEYFTSLYPGLNREWKEVQLALSDKKRFGKLKHLGKYSDPYSIARKFYLTKDTSIVGIDTPSDLEKGSNEWKQYVSNIDNYLKYLMNVIARHRRNMRGGEWEFFNANRQLATEAIAKLIGVEHLIPHSEFAVLILPDGVHLKGTIMDSAKGIGTEGINGMDSNKVASPLLQRELTSLNILDAITFERDHRPGNYNIILDNEGKVKSLSVFDNDADMTFAPFSINMHSGSGSSNVLRNGVFNRPHLDYEVAKRILQLNKEEAHSVLKPYLNCVQILMCWRRILTLQKAIYKACQDEGFLLKPEQWSESTMIEELSGKYGRTYLDTFVYFEKYFKKMADYYCAPITLS